MKTPLLVAAVLLTVLPLVAQTTPIAQWKLANFTPTQLSNGTSDDNADANVDGTSNLLAYAFGITPFQPIGAALPTSSISSDRLRLSFNRLSAVPDLIYVPEVSADLRTWTATTSGVSITPLGGGLERVIVQDAVSVSGSVRRFIRLRVERTVFDSNNDGLLDDWQLKYFGSLSSTGNAAPLADPDSDGFTNIEESAVGTNPTTAAAPDSVAVLTLTLWTKLR